MKHYTKRISVFLLFLLLFQMLSNTDIPNFLKDNAVFAEITSPTPTSTPTGTPVPIELVQYNDIVNLRDTAPLYYYSPGATPSKGQDLELVIDHINYKIYVMQHPTIQDKLQVTLICDDNLSNISLSTQGDRYGCLSYNQYYFKINDTVIPPSEIQYYVGNINTWYIIKYSYPINKPLTIDVPKRSDNTVLVQIKAEGYFYSSGGGGNYTRCNPNPTVNYSKSFLINQKPVISVINPAQNTIYRGQDPTKFPSISVSDANCDTLTCRYYIDSEVTKRSEKTVSSSSTAQIVDFDGGFNPNTLTQGSHKIRFEVTDGIGTTIVNTFVKIDRSPPTLTKLNITSTETSISVIGTAKDNISGLNANPYNYTVGAQSSSWTSSNAYVTQTALIPNTQYTVIFNAKDKKDNILSLQKKYYTKAQVPSISSSNITANTITISKTDSNPSTTKYQVMVGDKYVSQTGTLSTTPSWITLTNSNITVTGLTTKTTYSIKVKARNEAGIGTAFSIITNVTTL